MFVENVRWKFPECSLNVPRMTWSSSHVCSECSMNVPWTFPKCNVVPWPYTAFNIGSPLALRIGLTWAGSFHVHSMSHRHFYGPALHLRKPEVEWAWNERGIARHFHVHSMSGPPTRYFQAIPRSFHVGSSYAIFSGHSTFIPRILAHREGVDSGPEGGFRFKWYGCRLEAGGFRFWRGWI
jgi:hypothetical protein